MSVSPLKVLDVTEFYSERGGGVRSHLSSKARELARRGIQHRVVAPGPRDEIVRLLGPDANPREELALALRLRGPKLPYDGSYHLLWRIGALREIVCKERPSVLEINSPYLAALAVLSMPKNWSGTTTFFWHADFIDTYLRAIAQKRVPERAIDWTASRLWSYVRRIARACDATLVGSQTQADKLNEHGVERVCYVPLGVDTDLFTPLRRDEGLRRYLLGADRGTLLVGMGRFAIEKHWELVLDAVELARSRSGRDLTLLLFGDGPERARLEKRVGSRYHVRFAGFERDRTHLATVLASADLLVHGCAHETFGLGVAEAVSSGLPVVVPAAGGAGEVAASWARGPSSEAYEPGDAEACAAAILRVLERGDDVVRRAALDASRRAPSISGHVARVIDLYSELLARQRKSRRKAAA